jgi:hypothetical protein
MDTATLPLPAAAPDEAEPQQPCLPGCLVFGGGPVKMVRPREIPPPKPPRKPRQPPAPVTVCDTVTEPAEPLAEVIPEPLPSPPSP